MGQRVKTPSKPFQEVKPVVGAFVLGSLVIVLGLVFATARARRWFERVVAIEIDLPEEGSFGLRRGSTIEMLGSVVGSVDEIWIDDKTDAMRARLQLQTSFRRFVRVDSKFEIKRRTLGLAGDAYVEITRGTKALASADQKFAATVDRAPTELLQDISGELLPTIRAARDVIQSHGTLAQKLADPEGAMLQSLQHIERILGTLERNDGLAGRILNDRDFANRVDKLLASLQLTLDGLRVNMGELTASTKDLEGRASILIEDAKPLLARIRDILEKVFAATNVLPELAVTIRDEAKLLPGVVLQSRNALAELEKLVAALQDHWLIRGYVQTLPPPGRLSPAELGGFGTKR